MIDIVSIIGVCSASLGFMGMLSFASWEKASYIGIFGFGVAILMVAIKIAV